MANQCIFCDIVAKKVPADVVHEDDRVIAFKDNQPSAPVHLLVIPKEHHPNLDSLSDEQTMVDLFQTANRLGQEHSPELGYRLAINSADQADVNHVHLHILGGLQKSAAPNLTGR